MDGKEDIRSSYYLEDVATEFHVQGLELDWACVTWDADFRYTHEGWKCFSFVGNKWNNINKEEQAIVFEKCLSGFINKGKARNGYCCAGR